MNKMKGLIGLQVDNHKVKCYTFAFFSYQLSDIRESGKEN